jgi:hypothetical protein
VRPWARQTRGLLEVYIWGFFVTEIDGKLQADGVQARSAGMP